MQTFSPLHCSSWDLSRVRARGFTLIELLISVAIITVISAVVLVRFHSFDSALMLKNSAYEASTAVRQAQAYAVSVLKTASTGDDVYRYPYGVTFSPTRATYSIFRYEDASTAVRPHADGTDAVTVEAFTMTPGIHVLEVCVMVSSGATYCDQDDDARLDISFRRPEFSAIYYPDNITGYSGTGSDVEHALIRLQATDAAIGTWVIDVGLLGQISVYKE
jgi:prepilin-type N-terminal cleavage/methylation domain-containing protein